NELSCSMASTVICLATVVINNQVDDRTSHSTRYTSPALTQKVFANMRRVGKGGCIQIGGKIEAIDADEHITLVDVETQEKVVDMDAKLQGRIYQDVSAATKDVNAVEPTVFDDEEVIMTMAQTLIKLKVEKAKLLDKQMAQRLHDEEVEKAATREK
nr:hypothetical protein [Tanacetum cinerariifolium]